VVAFGVDAEGVALSSDWGGPELGVEIALLLAGVAVVNGTDAADGVDALDWARDIGEQIKIKLAASMRGFITS
jgi:hypothetical protein